MKVDWRIVEGVVAEKKRKGDGTELMFGRWTRPAEFCGSR